MRPLTSTHPELAAQWHPSANGALRPDEVTAGAGRRVWWTCPESTDHVWAAIVGTRAKRGVGCPFCSGHRVSTTNSLATRFPAVAAQWHPTMNAPLTARQITAGSGKPVWWRCARTASHVFPATPNRRTAPGRTTCPFCIRLRRGEVLGSHAGSIQQLLENVRVEVVEAVAALPDLTSRRFSTIGRPSGARTRTVTPMCASRPHRDSVEKLRTPPSSR